MADHEMTCVMVAQVKAEIGHAVVPWHGLFTNEITN